MINPNLDLDSFIPDYAQIIVFDFDAISDEHSIAFSNILSDTFYKFEKWFKKIKLLFNVS